jgi:hypothetical protein
MIAHQDNRSLIISNCLLAFLLYPSLNGNMMCHLLNGKQILQAREQLLYQRTKRTPIRIFTRIYNKSAHTFSSELCSAKKVQRPYRRHQVAF